MQRILIGLLIFSGSLNGGYANDTHLSIQTLLLEGSQQQRTGYYLDAQNTFQTALAQAEQQHDQYGQALAKSALGHIAHLLHRPERAETLLADALASAKQLKKPDLITVTHYYSGLAMQGSAAQTHLQTALAGAASNHNLELIARCHLALAQLADNLNDFKQHRQLALNHIDQFKQPALAGELRLMLVEQDLEHPLLPPLTLDNGAEAQRLASLYQQLTTAHRQLPVDGQRHQAQYHGLLGKVYESQQRYPEALTLTQNALAGLQNLKDDDLKIFYNWQAARLHTALQQPDAAIASYRRAISVMQKIRQDIPVIYDQGQSSFFKMFGPIYRGATALLLQQIATVPKQEQNALLTEARGLMEQLRQTELEDFFNDRCLITDLQPNTDAKKTSKTAVLYPIVLEDRLELLLSVGDQLIQQTVAVESQELVGLINDYITKLRQQHTEAKRYSTQLYHWLIQPLEAELQANAIDTLIYIPDGALRILPLGLLYDGQQYLLEHYAITISPSMALIPASHQAEPDKTLLAGLSEPSIEGVRQLPTTLLQQLKQQKPTRSAGIGGRSKLSKTLGQIAEESALPAVTQEISHLASKLDSQVILNQDFTLQNFDQAVKQGDYGLVHIASHGYFGSDSAESFVLTYDKLLKMDHLETLLQSGKPSRPLDLLVFSACQTAEGDDRAPLGLAGVVLKAKAENVLGSLWNVDDKAAAKVMQDFYDGFTQKGLSKTKALQQAQLHLRQDPDFANPYYWAPFVLVGNGE